MAPLDYSHKHDEEILEKLVDLKKKLPKFLTRYFISKEDLLPSTLFNYATDLMIFFEWARDQFDEYAEMSLRNLPLTILTELTSDDINLYIKDYLTKYERDGHVLRNDYNGKARKLASLKSIYKFFLADGSIDHDPTAIVTLKAKAEHEIVYLQPNEVALLLDCIDDGEALARDECENINKRREAWHKLNRTRDLAIITMLLGTGMRVSECVGLNVTDIDFDDGAIHITRKGHRRDTVYMGEEIEETLKDYLLNARDSYQPPEDEPALFLSLRHKRITVRSVELLLKKYVQAALPYRSGEKISPHKMRSTFGTTLYKETGDIKLVADTLGHKNIATTQKHYAASDTEIKRSAFRNVKLRDK